MIIETYPDRAAWLAARGGTRIGASEAAAVLGVSRYKTPWDLWEQRQPGALPQGETEQQAAGTIEEPLVLQKYAALSGLRVLRPAEALGVQGEVVIRHPVYEWATCTPDALLDVSALWCQGEVGGPCWCGRHDREEERDGYRRQGRSSQAGRGGGGDRSGVAGGVDDQGGTTAECFDRDAQRRIASAISRETARAHGDRHPTPAAQLDAALTWALGEAKSSRLWDGWGPSGQEIWPPTDEVVWPCPVEYVVQVYVQMEVTGLPFCDLVVQMPHFWDVRWYRFHRDPGLQAALLEAVGAWRERHLVQGKPPPVDASEGCTRYLRRAFPDRLGREATPMEAVGMMHVSHQQHVRDAAEAEIALTKNWLRVCMQGAERITTPTLVFNSKTGRLDERKRR